MNELKEKFETIYKTNKWGSTESISGPGSEVAITEMLRKHLIEFIKKEGIRRIVDVGCGDFNWMKLVLAELDVEYKGFDIVEELVAINNDKWANKKTSFFYLNPAERNLHKNRIKTLTICRDFLSHLPFETIQKVLDNVKASGTSYMGITSYLNCTENKNIDAGQWRRLNFMLAPFKMNQPYHIIEEYVGLDAKVIAGHKKFGLDKTLSIWKYAEI
ncbi:MAG TPA: hypothetical protein PLA71_01025 [Saccharofermentans sp.]|nr:hypothetical protein [Saccharofermentans sp.]